MVQKNSENGPIFDDMRIFAELWARELPGADPELFGLIGSILRLATLLENEFRSYTQSTFDMGTGDMRILLALRRAGAPFAMRPTDLFQSLLITSGAVTKQVERLTRRGFVDRIPDVNRKRSWQIHLTEEGKRVTDSALDAINTEFNISAAFHRLPKPEREAGNEFLVKMIEGFKSSSYRAKV